MLSIMDEINVIINKVSNVLWGFPTIALVLGTGIYLSIRLGFIQITKIKTIFNNTIKVLFKKSSGDGVISSGEAALVSLGEKIGAGNVVGVATAIAAGGPGALFWMWVAAIFGMATKFAEITLGIAYRKVMKKDGNVKGGPMYYLKDGVHSKFLAGFYAIMAVICYLVIIAMVDSNTIVNTINEKMAVPNYITAIILMIIVGIIIFGGIKRLGKFSKFIVPTMAVLYVSLGLIAILCNYQLIGKTFAIIIKAAFTPQAAAGGFAGASVAQIMRYGFARGIYSNEAGLGTAAFAHSAATTDHPIKQALWGPTEVFIDTILVNTISGLVIIMSGLWVSGATGSVLVLNAFDKVMPGGIGKTVVFFATLVFAFVCLTSSSYICQEAAEYLFGRKSEKIVNVLWLVFIFVGAITKLELVWNLSDIVNCMMLIPNLIGVLILSKQVIKLKKEYLKK